MTHFDRAEYDRFVAEWDAGYPDSPMVLRDIALKRIEARCMTPKAAHG